MFTLLFGFNFLKYWTLKLDNMQVQRIYLHMCTFRPQWKSELNTYRVEAAWKLGQWDLLEDYLSSGNKILK